MAIPDEPLTRGEQFLAKIAEQDVMLPDAPLTRMEQYLAKIAGQDVATPDAPLSRMEQYLDYIAENGGGGGDITLETLNVSQNGTTNAPSGTAFNKVVASVPNTYAAGDDGKVVSNGALVSQTAHATVTQNGPIDTTLNNSVEVAVAAGGTISDANIIKNTTFVPGYLTDTGAMHEPSGSKEVISDYIDISNISMIRVTVVYGLSTASQWVGAGFYDADKVFISRLGTQIMTVPTGSKYARIFFETRGNCVVYAGDSNQFPSVIDNALPLTFITS